MTKTEIRDSMVKQLELRGMNAEFYKDMIDDYVYYWSLKKKLISDIKSKGLRYKTITETELKSRKQMILLSICKKPQQLCSRF